MKKILAYSTALLIMIVFVLIPFPASDLQLQIHFEEIRGYECQLYYATNDSWDYAAENCITASIDHAFVEFPLSCDLQDEIIGLRLDFPHIDQTIGIKDITLSSAGNIQKIYNPCDFFEGSNIEYSSGITEMSAVPSAERFYIATTDEDPHIVLSRELIDDLFRYQSNYRGTRVMICLFVTGCYLFAKFGPFKHAVSKSIA